MHYVWRNSLVYCEIEEGDPEEGEREQKIRKRWSDREGEVID